MKKKHYVIITITADKASDKNPTILITAQSINRLYNQNADCQIGFLKKQESNKCCLQKKENPLQI